MSKNFLYFYCGPVWNTFNDVIEPRWNGQTIAPGNNKALSNLKHRFRNERDIFQYSRIYLDPRKLQRVAPSHADDVVVEAVGKSKEDQKCDPLQLKLF